MKVGSVDGAIVVGSNDGSTEGVKEGSNVGENDGSALGVTVGSTVGSPEGVCSQFGLFVSTVGSFEGLIVG